MKKQYWLLLLICFSSIAQNSIKLKGKILDGTTQIPLEAATVYLSAVKDSSVVDYTITDKNGLFTMSTKAIEQAVFIKVSYMGYQTYKKEIKSITTDLDFGTLDMVENSNVLGEVVIKSEAPPIRIKKDTLEFNASSFKVRPDSNVQTLLKQLPGVEIDTEGKITVNGKEVNQVLVNGKPFFNKDGKIALQSLPSDIINKVQISDTKTKKEELAGQAASSNSASINLTIDEDKNKGFFGKFMGGYGTDDRYESSALLNYFKNKRKISLLASSNNINSTGFSMDEIFDNMGGGRNVSYYSGSDGSFGIGNMRFGGGKGITRSNMVGLNYADEWFKDFDTSGSYFFSNATSNNVNRSKQLNFLPTGNYTTASSATTREERYGHNFNFNFEYKIDSTATIVFTPKINISNRKFDNNSFETSTDEANQLLNESRSKTADESDKSSFGNEINFNKKFKKKDRFLSLVFENENDKELYNVTTISNTVFYQSGDPDDSRNQIKKNRTIRDMYRGEIEYTEPVTDSLKIRVGVDYKWEKASDDRKAFDFDETTQTYTATNDLLTNFLMSTTKTLTPKVGFGIDKKKYNFNLDAGPSLINFDNSSLYLSTKNNLNKNYIVPYANARISFRISKSKSIWSSYSYNNSLPSSNQVLPVNDLSNPLNTFIGNPNLGLNKYHNMYFSFRDYDYSKRSGYSIYMGGNFYDSQIVSDIQFDANRKRITTYDNVSGTYSSWIGTNWNKTIKKEGNTYKFGATLSSSFSLLKGFSNGVQFDAQSVRFSPRANFTYEYGELLTINPSYSLTYNETNYSNYVVKAATNVVHQFNIQTTNYWPKNWVFGNDFGYTFNSNIADGFKKDFYLWNSSLAYSFYNKKITAKVKVYDLLNQNQSATRTISPTTITDEQNTVLRRYMMFSLTYKIEKFGGKEKPSRGGIFFMY
jgi:hypothetical protein